MGDQNAPDPRFEELNTRWGVSRETFERLRTYQNLLLKWQSKINLISQETKNDIWKRHILDSAQIFPLIPENSNILVDIGSGAGFPGLVLAIMGIQDVHLVESDQRKSAFLQEAARVTSTNVTIHNRRMEEVDLPFCDTITARGCAPLKQLFQLSERIFQKNSLCLFLKGKNYTKEVEEASEEWQFSLRTLPSITDQTGSVLVVNNLIKKHKYG